MAEYGDRPRRKGRASPTPTEDRLARVLDLSCLFLVFGRQRIENIRSPTVSGRTCKSSGSRGLLPQSLHLSQYRQVDEHIHRAGERSVLAEQRRGIGQETEAGAVRPFSASFDPSRRPLLAYRNRHRALIVRKKLPGRCEELPSNAPTAVMPFRTPMSAAGGCHLYFARRVTFLSCADNN
jgi:hypothetical protein